MSEELRSQIYQSLNLRETDDLLEIWQANDHVEWSEDAFEVIRAILTKRGVELPRQDEPVATPDEKEDLELSEVEARIVDDENPPDFYDPFDVLKTARQIEICARVLIAVMIAYQLANLPGMINTVRAYFLQFPDSPLVYVVASIVAALDAAIAILILYFPLMALSRILKILMEMEFRSRKAALNPAQ